MPIPPDAAVSAPVSTPATAIPPSDDLWRFAVDRYACPGVAAACLELQDRFDADVPLLLWAVWAGERHGHALDIGDIRRAQSLVAEWRSLSVLPLRHLRRWLKGVPAPFPLPAPSPAEVAAFREQVKALELAAERLQLAALGALAADWPPPPATPAAQRVAAGIARHNLTHLLPADALPVTQALHLSDI